MAARSIGDALVAGRPVASATAAPAVSLSGVTRVFGSVPALIRASLRVERGEILLLRGPNGAGKTTLLRVVATALSPTFGGGSVLGFDLLSGREEIRRRTEFLGHRTRLYEDLTARENLRFACSLYGVDAHAVPAALDRLELSEVADERVRRLSQGMRQRLSLGRCLLRAPELLLLDEPYAGLDARSRDLLDGVIRQAAADHRTVLLATHDRDRGEMADRAVFMEGGRILTGPAA